MRTPATITTVVLTIASLAACGNAGSGNDGNCPDAPQLKVTDTGSEPLQELRFSPKEGDSVALDLQMDMSMSIEADGSPVPTGSIPTMTMGAVATIEHVTDDEIEMAFEYDKASVDGGPPGLESTLQTLVGTSGTLTTNANGVYVDGDLEPASGMAPNLQSIMQQLEQQLANMTVPLPGEAVGTGAVWEVETPFELNGLQTCNTYTYTLDQLNGSTYTLDVEIDQQMEPGTTERNGVETKLVEGSSTGSGTIRGDLGMPVAVSGRSSVSSSTKMEVDQGGDTQELDTQVEMQMRIGERE